MHACCNRNEKNGVGFPADLVLLLYLANVMQYILLVSVSPRCKYFKLLKLCCFSAPITRSFAATAVLVPQSGFYN